MYCPAYHKAYRAANKEKNRAYQKAYREQNKEKFQAYQKGYRAANKAKIRAQQKEYRDTHQEKASAYQKEYQKHNAARGRELQRAWRAANPERQREINRRCVKNNPERARRNRKNWLASERSINYRLSECCRHRTRKALKGISKSAKTLELLGCSIPELRQRLESRFQTGMAWENHGTAWHIDHVKPCAKFDLSDPKQQKACFHYTNLQPLWAEENITKGARYG